MNLSIITVVRNGAATIADCLQSVRNQSYPAEHLIIDGASTDGTLNALRRYQALGNCRFVTEPDRGIYDAMNKGIGIATGDVIGILNADDFYASPYVLEQVAEVFIRSGVDSCYGDLVYVGKARGEGLEARGKAQCMRRNEKRFNDSTIQRFNYKIVRYWKSGPFRRENFYWGWMPPHPTFFVRRKAYETYGVFDTSLGSAADYELMLRLLLKHRINCAYIPEVIVHMRTGGVSNKSMKNRLQANLMDRKAWRVNGLKPHLWTLWLKPMWKIPQFYPQIMQIFAH